MRRKLVLAVLVLGLIGGYLVWRLRASGGFAWDEFLTTFRQADPLWLALAFVMVLLTYAGRAVRWVVMLRPLKPNPSFRRILGATCIGFTAIVVFGRAGEFVRPYLIAARERVPLSSQLAAWFLERLLDLLMVILIFGAALARISHSGAQLGPGIRWMVETGGYILGAIGVLCILLILLFRYMSDAMHRRLSDALRFLPEATHRRVDGVLKAFIEGMGSTRSGSFIAQLVGYSLLEWLLIALGFGAIFRAFPATAAFSTTDVVIFLGVVAFGSAVQIPGIGGGMQVASILVLTEFFRLPLEVSTGIALAVWAFSFLAIVPVGLALALREGLNLRKLTRLSDSESSTQGFPAQ